MNIFNQYQLDNMVRCWRENFYQAIAQVHNHNIRKKDKNSSQIVIRHFMLISPLLS